MHGPMDFAKTLQLRFRVVNQDLLERRKRKYTRSREEEEVDAQMCPFGKAMESRTNIVGENEINVQGGTGCIGRGDEGDRRM